MKKRLLQGTRLSRWLSFTLLKGFLLLIVLQFTSAITALADTWNAGDYFNITHTPTPAEPYIDFEYVSNDYDGINDILAKSEFYIGWNGAEYKILSYGRGVNNEQKYNTKYGTTEQLNGCNYKERYYRKRRFYPSTELGSGTRSVLNKKFYIRMKGRWDIDDNESNGDYDIDKKREVVCSAYTAFIGTPDVIFKRTSKTNVHVSTTGLNPEGAFPWASIAFTTKNTTRFPDICYNVDDDLGFVTPDSKGNMSKDFTISKSETEPIVLYYHKVLARDVSVEGTNVHQCMDGELKTWTHKGFQNPSDLQASYNKYTENTSLQWTNNTDKRNTEGKNYIFRATNGGSWTKIATLACNINRYEDTSAPVGFKYDYAVMFVPDTYTSPTTPDLSSALTSRISTAVGEEKNFEVSLNAETTGNGGITLTWTPETDAYPLTYILERFDSSTGRWNAIYTGDETSWTDTDDLKSYHTYDYRVKTKFWETDWITSNSITFQVMTKLTEVNATRGMYTNTVKVTWKASHIGTSETRYVVSRRPLNDPTAPYVDVYEVNGMSSTYIFEDNNALPGQYYMYRVTPYVEIPEEERAKNPNLGEWGVGSSIDTDGFSISRGIITGRVTYGTGTAVPGVKVCLEKVIDNDNNQQQYYSLSSTKGCLQWTPSDKVKSYYLKKDPYTVQMWVMAADKSTLNDNNCILSVGSQMSLYLSKLSDNDDALAVKVKLPDGNISETGLTVPVEKFSNVSFASDGNNNYVVSVVGEEGVDSVSIAATNIDWDAEDATLTIGGSTVNGEQFDGYVDDVRVWTRVLSKNEINDYHKRILSGSEQGLLCYWPLDEGINNMPYAYDVSKKNGIANGNHANVMQGARSATMVPTSEQLALFGETNSEGGYEIRGIPFSGEGTSYIVRPILGAHEFNAKYMTRFVSNNSLNHSSVDFTDVSSFPVDGHVYYENTTIPVADAYVYVDGVVASKDGEPIMTDEEGHYSVDVPIGDHFIQIKKNGHTFTNNGRYPADPKSLGLRETFEAPVTGLTFWDDTKVMVAGRVAGGSVEENKPLGLQQGTANIGRATIKLKFPGNETGKLLNAKKEVDGTAVNYVMSDEKRNFSTNILGGKAYVEGGTNVLTIETDSTTGEFAAYLPPLYYETTEITIPTQQEIVFTNKPVLDATSPDIVYTDSIEDEDGKRTFDYVASAKIIYRSPSHLEVTENKNGSFGMDSLAVKDINGKSEKVALYTINEDKTINYPFGAPVYQMLGRYTYHLYAYETYTTYDVAKGADPITVQVPIPNSRVTVKNQFASTTTVAEADGAVGVVSDEDFNLDEDGRADYTFICGLPNIQSPFTRTLNISYEVNGTAMEWDGNETFKAVVLGTISTGTNFVTEGPDKVTMILRDPPGSLSKTTYSVGTEVTSVNTYTNTFMENAGIQSDIYSGCSMQTGGGLGFIALSELKATNTLSIGADYAYTYNNLDQYTTVTTLTKDISTSDGTDFVGSGGDVFIGTSNNLVFGTCHNVGIKKNETDGSYNLVMTDGVSMGEQFNTDFSYTQNYVENVLIPNFENLRNGKLTRVEDVSSVTAPTGDEPIYVTTLSEDDERFGSNNDDKEVWGDAAKKFVIENGRYTGPSYTMILPAGFSKTNTSKDNKKTGVQDMVKYYNEQILQWQNQLRFNEEQKVKAINDRGKYLDRNYSFDAGAVVTSTIDTLRTETTVEDNIHETNVILSNETGLSVCGVGLGIIAHSTTQSTISKSTETTTTSTTSMSFTLQEDGDDDYLSVDVFKAPDGFGPIFVTRAGATCAPYEDEVVTKYYEPGTIIAHKTQQIEKPEIEIVDAIVTGVPGGEDAKFRVKLRNNSDTQEDCYFGFRVEANSNPDGAQVFVDGQNLGSNPTLLIPYGETVKTFSLRQTDTDVLNYENIEITMYSTSQPDDTGIFPGIYSTGTVTVNFQPVCSNVILATNRTVVNTDTKNDVVLSMSGYDYSMSSFRDIRLEYKGIHDTDFRTLQEYTKDKGRLASNKNLIELPALTGTDKLNFVLDMTGSNFTDQTYVFRAVAVCIKGSEEVTRSSEEVEIIRDLSRPQLLSTPTPQSGVLYPGDDISITFNEPIRNDLLNKINNFKVLGVKNEGEVAHKVGLQINDKVQTSTEANINLDKRSFALGMWLKYEADGTLLQHGTQDNGMSVSITDDKLAVNINGKTVTSEATLPKNKWLYLMLSLDQEGDEARLDARFAHDASTTDLFHAYIGEYQGNGKLAIGGNALAGAMQEMTLWNKAMSLDELQGSMHKVKSNCTEGLAGYWRFDEGHGSVANDIVRNRHFTLNGESAWWKHFTNYALTSGGKIDVSALGLNDDDDFVMETWMNADKVQTEGDVYVLANKPSKLALRMDSERRLQFDYSDKTAQVTDEAVNDNQWHHVAVAVNHSSNGYAKVYVDGKLRTQVPAQEVYAPRGEALYLGSYEDGETRSQMQGGIDEVRIWKGQRSASVINDWMYKRANGEEDMLALHLPFEAISINEYNQAVTVASYANTIDKKGLSQTGTVVLAASADKAPALNEAETLENINYSFVANENQITFRIEEQPADVEGRTVTFTARNIQDHNGNSNAPMTWSVLVKQSNLNWSEEAIDEVLPYGETGSFSAEIANTGITTENWVLSGVPSWLDVSAESGSLPALKNMTLRFTPQAGMAIGKYEATVMLTGSQGIAQPLYVSLYVKGQAPDWAAIPDEQNMNVIGQLKVDGIISTDPDDMLAAFRAGKCVGVAQPKYLAKYDAYLVMMDVYGNQEQQDNALEYKMYDASTGTVYPLVSASDIKASTFVADTWVGSFTSPVTFSPENKIEQTLACNYEGWKWFSLFAKPEAYSVSGIFAHSGENIAVIKDDENSAYMANGAWSGTLTDLTLNRMYKVKTKAAFSEAYLGTPAEDEKAEITLANGWTWIGYPVSRPNSLNNALAGAEPQEGDMVKGQSGFAIYTDNQWIGSLGMMTPGLGYQYFSNAAASKSFTFPKVKATAARRVAARDRKMLELDYEDNMTLIAVVKEGDCIVEDAKVSVYAGGKLCGRSEAPVTGDRHFITVGGNEETMLTIVVETPAGSRQLSQMLTFKANAHHGSMNEPFVIQMDNATALSQISADLAQVVRLEVIDNAGRVVRSIAHPTALTNASQHLPAGIYYIRLTYRTGETKCQTVVIGN